MNLVENNQESKVDEWKEEHAFSILDYSLFAREYKDIFFRIENLFQPLFFYLQFIMFGLLQTIPYFY